MANINEPAQKLWGEYFLINPPILLQGAIIPEQPKQQEPKLIKSLALKPLLNILKLNHMTISLMWPHQKHNNILQSIILNIFNTYIII